MIKYVSHYRNKESLAPFYFRNYSSFIIVWRFLDLAADKYIIWDLWVAITALHFIFWSVSRALCFIMFDGQMKVMKMKSL